MASAARMVFVNLPVRNLERTRAFFAGLGFEFNQQFSDEKAACMVLSEQGYVMLLTDAFFQTFTRRQLCDSGTHTEALIALSCESRQEVDALADKAIAAGGSHAIDAQDHGFMYSRSFYDIDGHHWELLWMDPKAVQ